MIAMPSPRRLLLATATLVLLSACAPNSARGPAPVAGAEFGATDEESHYGSLLRMAASTRQAGDSGSAVQLYQQAIAIEPHRSDAYLLLGETLLDVGAYDEAARAFEAAFERDEELAAAHRGYGRALLGVNRPDGAIPHFRRALELDPADLKARNGLGVAYDLQGRHDAAQAVYREGLVQAPDSLLLRNNLGLSLALGGESDEAIQVLEAVARQPGARARTRQNLALAHGLAGNLGLAEEISRIDLDEEAVQNNLAYYTTLAAIEDPVRRAAALGAERTSGAPSGDARAALQVIALEGGDFELGVITAGRWFVNLGAYRSTASASSAWRRMKGENPDVLGGLTRLASADPGRQPLLAGPLASADEAQQVCAQLRARSLTCRPTAL